EALLDLLGQRAEPGVLKPEGVHDPVSERRQVEGLDHGGDHHDPSDRAGEDANESPDDRANDLGQAARDEDLAERLADELEGPHRSDGKGYATDSQGEAAESPADDGGPADDALLSVIQPPIPVRELLGGIHDPGAQVEDNPAEGAKVADQVADQVLEVFV